MNAAGTPVWHKQIVRAVDGKTNGARQTNGKGGSHSVGSEFINGAAIHHETECRHCRTPDFEVNSIRRQGGFHSVRSEFKDLAVAGVAPRHKQILRRRGSANQNNRSQAQYAAR